MQFTEAQNEAINSKGGTLLVSAGAGSGKTSVLTERIIQKICGESENFDITDFLVVTFTRASATDLKNKISRAINKKLSENIGSAHLKKQQILLGNAAISTIHSFCRSLINANFEKLGIPANFRMADENEMSIIKRSLLDELLEKYHDKTSEIYASQSEFTHEDFIFAIENFMGAKDDENIYGVILKMHDKVNSEIDGSKLFAAQISLMREITALGKNAPFFSTAFGKSIKAHLSEGLSGHISEIKKITAQISAAKFEVIDKKYSPCLANMRNFFADLSEIIDEGNLSLYGEAYEVCAGYESVKVGSHRIDKEDEASIELKDILDKKLKNIKKSIDYAQKLFEYDFYDMQRFARSYEKSLVALSGIISRFDINLNAEKMRLKSFEFSDLERLAFRLLIEKTGENGELALTDLAKQLKGSYKEIYIDEYQDTNKIQDMIFRAISTENDRSENGNRFMVGDVKQSIYAFRGAKPEIFSLYSKTFGEFAANPFSPKKIYLKKNFRSSPAIIDFINHIFSSLFSEKLGGVKYTGGEVLESGKIFDEVPGNKTSDVSFALVEKDINEESNGAIENESEEPEKADGENLENDLMGAVTSAEAEYVALTIKKLLGSGRLKNGEKILPRHITVLMRNYTKGDLLMDALKKYEIPCYTDKAKGFLASAEIMLVVSMLKTVDNPTRDIDLAATLKSPVFQFSLDDLICITNENQKKRGYKDPLFKYVRNYAESGRIPELQKKCGDFLDKLNLWRAKSRILPVDKFIWHLYRQTDMMAKISLESFAAEREANLMLLYEYARKFEETTFKGLYGFINYLNDVQKGKNDFEKAKVISENSDVVKIMSVHKAKGLEFPVCILANTGSPFNKGDYQGNPAISDEGIYFDLKYTDGIGIEKTPFKKLFSEKIKGEALSEEARILYVALTRAVEKLIIVGSVDNIEKFLDKNAEISDHSAADSTLKWLAQILLDSGGNDKTKMGFEIDLVHSEKLREMMAAANSGGAQPETPCAASEDADSAKVLEYRDKIRHMYNFEYKNDFLSKVPAKISVSSLHPGILGEDEYSLPEAKELKMSPLPRFLEEKVSDDPALAGTATHLFMQFADFGQAEIYGAKDEAKNLLGGGFLNLAQCQRIDFSPIDRFFSSDLYGKIKAAKRVYRETPFNLKVSVRDFLDGEAPEGDEYVLIQGAIDLFFEDKNGKAYVVDFKTDRVHEPNGAKILLERHGRQIGYYCMAVREMLGRPVDGAYIYSFALDKAVEANY
ncbi:MAG: helicase-exonuclease AddAB subunit AddA [Oscillospiraceae bacterium]|nr:helicase-exonuclease AddAB subunit AddA [Oscillospiraceae bacterium]